MCQHWCVVLDACSDSCCVFEHLIYYIWCFYLGIFGLCYPLLFFPLLSNMDKGKKETDKKRILTFIYINKRQLQPNECCPLVEGICREIELTLRELSGLCVFQHICVMQYSFLGLLPCFDVFSKMFISDFPLAPLTTLFGVSVSGRVQDMRCMLFLHLQFGSVMYFQRKQDTLSNQEALSALLGNLDYQSAVSPTVRLCDIYCDIFFFICTYVLK